MMKKMIYTIILTACTFFVSCKSDSSEGYSVFSVNYIQDYLYPEELVFVYGNGGSLLAYFQGESVGNTKTKDKERYAVLSDKYNDKSWNTRMLPFSTAVIEQPVEYLTVTCDRRFDETHDAGVSLNDIVVLRTSSPYDFVKDGYKITDPSLPREGTAKGYIVTEGLLSEIGIEDIRLMNPEFRLTFATFPAPGTYTLTVTAKIGEKQISQSIDMTFE